MEREVGHKNSYLHRNSPTKNTQTHDFNGLFEFFAGQKMPDPGFFGQLAKKSLKGTKKRADQREVIGG